MFIKDITFNSLSVTFLINLGAGKHFHSNTEGRSIPSPSDGSIS